MPNCQLLALATIVVLCGSLASGQAVPSCKEDGSVVSLVPNAYSQGTLTPFSSATCPGGISGKVLASPAAGVVSFTSGLSFLYAAPNTSVTDSFIMSEWCGATMLCTARFSMNVAPPTGAPTPAPSTTFAPQPVVPSCGVNSVLTVLPGSSYQGILPVGSFVCPSGFSGAIAAQPPQGSGAVIVTNGISFFFAAPTTNNVLTTFSYIVSCNGAMTCQGNQSLNVYLPTAPPTPMPPLGRCPLDQMLYVVLPSAQISDTLNVGLNCTQGLAPSATVVTQPSYGAFVFTTGMRYIFQAPTIEMDVVIEVRAFCGVTPVCQSSVGFMATSQTAAPTAVPSTAQPTPPPTAVPSTQTPTTAAPPVPPCNTSYAFQAAIGQQLLGQLAVPITQNCAVETYLTAPSTTTKGTFVVNVLGNFLYAPSNAEGTETVGVDVYCVNSFVCRAPIVFTAYRPVTPMPTTTAVPPATPVPTVAPLASCANVYYYYVKTGGTISNSLRGMPGEDACALGRSFTVIRGVQDGSLVFTTIGDFTFQAPNREAFFDFGFQMTCLGKVYCQGSAYIQVSNTVTSMPTVIQTATNAPNYGTPSPPTSAPSIVLPNQQMTCRGTCNDKAWKTVPNLNLWDDTVGSGNARSDGKPTNGIDVVWMNNSLVITAYSLIGNLGARFPTFEPLVSYPGSFLTPADLASQAVPSSTGFQQSCLNNQAFYGLGEDVWKWISLSNRTGRVGANYASGSSWYQKFGGKHVNCDTFINSCQFAPLLTPSSVDPSLGRWVIDINDCDATWTGVFPRSAISSMLTVQGKRVWNYAGFRQLAATIYSEAVRASSWLDPTKGFDSNLKAYNILADLHSYVTIRKISPVSTFSFDTEYFEYQTSNGDYAFGVNILFFPYVTLTATSSYGADRHVMGFKWINQNWQSPSNAQCPTCTGTKTLCTVPQQFSSSTYLGDFPPGDCPFGTGRITLSKGPMATSANCTASPMHVFNRAGFSPTRNCTTTYQNLTVRGVALGSNGLTADLLKAFTYEGSFQLQLLLDNGDKPIISVDLSLFVSRLATSTSVPGELSLCRASSYWPVLDPFGTSTPERPLALSRATPGYLCAEMLDRNFGPSGWVTMFLSLPAVTPSQVFVNYVRMRYSNITVYLYYTDPATNLAAIPPASAGLWWQRSHPFLNFRNLGDRITNGSISVDPMTNTTLGGIPFAFTFTPGVISVDTQVEIVVAAVISVTNADGSVTSSPNTFTRFFHVDPLLTSESRNGPLQRLPKVAPPSTAAISSVVLLVPLLFAAVVAGFCFVGNNDKPLHPIIRFLLSKIFGKVDTTDYEMEALRHRHDTFGIIAKLGDVKVSEHEESEQKEN